MATTMFAAQMNPESEHVIHAGVTVMRCFPRSIRFMAVVPE
ncbi:hypothetical protein LHGZ1_1866 [Laribacter hongkongensis]|uniref:Uncharacterized protein n=1 Tax=Laribacter hongkongensis TaxID=168471 RepID=A0A248LIW7_9NEIS|nr:hypothetical protein LHGZ1_1866 [Laribacter hongkongensis]